MQEPVLYNILCKVYLIKYLLHFKTINNNEILGCANRGVGAVG